MTNISKGKRSSAKLKSMGDHDAFLSRISKTLYYSKLPMTDCLSLPVTELAAELFTEAKNGRTLERLDVEEASRVSRNACVSPCSLVLALLYLERLKDCNPEYLNKVAPSELFLVSLMVASKFLHDDGEEDEVFNNEWARSGDLTVPQINRLEKEFLNAIDWAVFIADHDFWERLQKLEKDVAYKEARKRGWFSYTELTRLMDSACLATVIHTLVSVSSVCLATYAAGVVTLFGSALVASHLPGTILLAPGQSVVQSELVENNQIVTPENKMTTDKAETNVTDLFPCTEIHNPCSDLERVNRTENVGWEWWLSSIMTWLPEYSALQNDIDFDGQELSDVTSAFMEQSPYKDDNPVENAVDLIIDWKETLGLELSYPSKDWRYYANYVTKISLGHSH
ncbi:protein CNPPD1 [Cephus cinctus]|uniref:Protein CNPPD1 n=1 Tax=Cephus cinctus TaxID=211228 RepID=A0AAJ7FLV5_CEPCN|nr:protein CNPPD1 [Cephus cinctus]